jgi:rubrerythrin
MSSEDERQLELPLEDPDDWRCPRCGNPIPEEYRAACQCPSCGANTCDLKE